MPRKTSFESNPGLATADCLDENMMPPAAIFFKESNSRLHYRYELIKNCVNYHSASEPQPNVLHSAVSIQRFAAKSSLRPAARRELTLFSILVLLQADRSHGTYTGNETDPKNATHRYQ